MDAEPLVQPDEPEDTQASDPLAHPWIEEMRQYEPEDAQTKEAEAWF